jgi:protein-tyrosine phosphatase
VIPLVDTHVHLLAGLDDGPRTPADALAMCEAMVSEGVRMSVALAHQNERYPEITPERIRSSFQELVRGVRERNIDLTLFPCAEIAAHPDLEAAWNNQTHLSVADRGQYLLVEMPRGVFVDLRYIAKSLGERGVRLILAHPERHPELLHEPGCIEELIQLGCLVQVSSGSITEPVNRKDARALKSWLKRGIVHLVGSDGHSLRRRPPRLRGAYDQIVRWAGSAVADRVCSTNGLAILNGLPLRVPPFKPLARRWFSSLW